MRPYAILSVSVVPCESISFWSDSPFSRNALTKWPIVAFICTYWDFKTRCIQWTLALPLKSTEFWPHPSQPCCTEERALCLALTLQEVEIHHIPNVSSISELHFGRHNHDTLLDFSIDKISTIQGFHSSFDTLERLFILEAWQLKGPPFYEGTLKKSTEASLKACGNSAFRKTSICLAYPHM